MPDQDPATDPACPRLRQRLRHAARVASGLCTRCGTTPPEPGRKVCRRCGEKKRAAAEPAAPEPGSKASCTAVGIPNCAGAPTAPGTGAAARRCKRRGVAHHAAVVLPQRAAPSASPVARRGAHSTVGAMARAALPAYACAAPSPRSGACRVAAGASRWRRSASRPSERALPARDATPDGAPAGFASTAGSARQVQRAVPAAPVAPIPARPSVTSRRSGRRKSPWSTRGQTTNSGPSRRKPRPPPASSLPGCASTRWRSTRMSRSWHSARHEHGLAAGIPQVRPLPTCALQNRRAPRRHRTHRRCGPRDPREVGQHRSGRPPVPAARPGTSRQAPGQAALRSWWGAWRG